MAWHFEYIFTTVMKLVPVSILFLLIFVQTYSIWFVTLSFNLNRDFIIKNLCENRSRPELHCKGNCVFTKKMKEQEKQEANNQGPVKIGVSFLDLSARSFFAAAGIPVLISRTSYVMTDDPNKPVDRAFFIFHPPAV